MAQFLGTPKVQYFDSNGDPLSGGLLYTYASGSTTNKATYPTLADALAGTNANANPVVLDSRGEATVVLSGVTKLVLKDSAGSTVWTVDNASSADSVVEASVALNDITDVAITAVGDNEILSYDLGTTAWINQTANELGFYGSGGTDVALADGGTGASLVDPNADRIMFWDDSAGAVTWLTASTGLTISGTSITTSTSVYRSGSTDVALADGGTGASLTDPNADRIMFWDDSAGATTWLTAGSGLTITTTTIAADVTDSSTTTFTNKTLTAPIISSISNTGTLTLPTSTDTLVGRATTDTLTNKTLTAPVISTISNTGTITLPTGTRTLVATDTTDTLTNKTIDANGTGNSITNIDVADLANGTAGQLITWSAAAAPTTVATGSSGQVLTSNGAGAAPTFQAAAGDYVLISSQTASASATIEFTGLTSTYRSYHFELSGILPATDDAEFRAQFGTGATPTYQVTSYSSYPFLNTGTAQAPSLAYMLLSTSATAAGLGSTAGEGYSGYLNLIDPSNAIANKDLTGLAGYIDAAATPTPQHILVRSIWYGDYTAPVTAIKFYMDSGNIASGTILMYGVLAS